MNQRLSGEECPHPHSGTLRVSWTTCPNKDCPSRTFAYWDVAFEREEYWCGTCEILLQKPIFCLPINGKREDRLPPMETVIEHRLHQRRYPVIPLAVIAELPQALGIIATLIPKVQSSTPLIQKTIADINEAIANKNDPSKLLADLNTIMTDISTDFNALAAFFPPTTPVVA